MTTDLDATFFVVIKAWQQVHDSRFTRAGGSNEGDGLPWFGLNRNLGKDGTLTFFSVRKGKIGEF